MRSRILGLGLLLLAGCAAEDAPDLTGYGHTFDLAAHAAEAQPRVESRRIDFGTRRARLFEVGGWTGDDVFADDDSTFSWSLGEGSTLQVYVLEPRDLDVEARLRPYRIDGPPQRVEIGLNGRTVEVLTLRGGMRVYRFELPRQDLVRGRNVLELRNNAAIDAMVPALRTGMPSPVSDGHRHSQYVRESVRVALLTGGEGPTGPLAPATSLLPNGYKWGKLRVGPRCDNDAEDKWSLWKVRGGGVLARQLSFKVEAVRFSRYRSREGMSITLIIRPKVRPSLCLGRSKEWWHTVSGIFVALRSFY